MYMYSVGRSSDRRAGGWGLTIDHRCIEREVPQANTDRSKLDNEGRLAEDRKLLAEHFAQEGRDNDLLHAHVELFGREEICSDTDGTLEGCDQGQAQAEESSPRNSKVDSHLKVQDDCARHQKHNTMHPSLSERSAVRDAIVLQYICDAQWCGGSNEAEVSQSAAKPKHKPKCMRFVRTFM